MKRLLQRIPALIILIFVIYACSDNSSGPDHSNMITRDQARTALVQVIQNHSLSVPGRANLKRGKNSSNNLNLSVQNYIKTNKYKKYRKGPRGPNSKYLEEHIDIGPDGNFIPRGKWRDNHPNVCKEQNRYMKGAVKLLSFKIFAIKNGQAGYDVFAQYIDVETGQIEAQKEAEGNKLRKAIGNAWDKLHKVKSWGGFAGPCGQKKGLTLRFNAKTLIHGQGNNGGSATITDSTTAEIKLTYNTKKGIYEGSGKLKFVKFDVSVANSCQAPADAGFKVTKLIMDNSGSITEADIRFFDWKQGSCTIKGRSFKESPPMPTVWPIFHKSEVIRGIKDDSKSGPWAVENVYAIKKWKSVSGNEKIIGRKSYDHKKTFKGSDSIGKASEKTLIEIRR
ncbi:MAG TPA: hypothetical protein VE868_00480 [Balneolaceae bacterium]|nr:hypothetical protein [Balneolaceae bacterium]